MQMPNLIHFPEVERELAGNLSCPWLQSNAAGHSDKMMCKCKADKEKVISVDWQVPLPRPMPQTWPWWYQSLPWGHRQVFIFLTISLSVIRARSLWCLSGCWSWPPWWRAAGPKPEPVEVAKIHIHPGWDRWVLVIYILGCSVCVCVCHEKWSLS